MNCPNCHSTMVILELNEVEVDFCFSCHGVWLDQGELELLTEFTEELALFPKEKKTKEKTIRCPICRKKMEKVTYGQENPVVIDKCPFYHGLWLDKGELQTIIRFRGNDRLHSHLAEIFKSLNKE